MSINDIELKRWNDPQYQDLITDSLWKLGPRDKSGAHAGNNYPGLFVPQIPNQIIRRFSKKGDVVLDMFAGGGTSGIEALRLGRKWVGVELNPNVIPNIKSRLGTDDPQQAYVINGNSAGPEVLTEAQVAFVHMGKARADLTFLHPPYADIIKFSDSDDDLSTYKHDRGFYVLWYSVAANAYELTKDGGYACLVIGDIYTDGELVPLGFRCMELMQARGWTLKAINIKDIEGNEAKGRNKNLWRYRHLKNGTYEFTHEYVMVFKKDK